MSSARDALAPVLYTALNVSAVTTLATGGVHEETVSGDTDAPYGVIRHESERINFGFGRRIWIEMYGILWIVPGEWPGPADDLDRVADGLLDNVRLTVPGFAHIQTNRVGSISVPPRPEEGPPFFIRGGRYVFELDEVS